ncbi:hypothetical protein [Polyangium sorediatum]|uniref:PEGA domain-containing protein n=1 Tax=Polyangium sorediatum TaxID=889274 RepID=A0ABT6NPB6_9BACT|nr:hypothetical protein [Polyangium sorediatum]MDI1430159.1 hypothetical protein [Polyangium sorediatum]
MRRYLAFCLLALATATPSPGLAQPATAPQAEEATIRARKLHEDGLALYRAEQFSEAHAVFSAAWNLRKQYQIAGVLGDCEMRLGKYKDAAEHLAYYVKEYPQDRPVQYLERARAMLEEAKSHLGTLNIIVDEPGAEVFLDGKLVGVSPLAAPVFVEPGTRRLEAKRGDVRKTQTVEASAGSMLPVELAVRSPVVEARPRPASAPSEETPKAVFFLGAGVAASLGVASLLLTMASAADDVAEEYRRTHSIGSSTCTANTQLPMCRELHDLAVKQVPYFWGGVGTMVVAGAGFGAMTYLLLRPSGKATAPRAGLSVSPGPFFQVRGSF